MLIVDDGAEALAVPTMLMPAKEETNKTESDKYTKNVLDFKPRLL